MTTRAPAKKWNGSKQLRRFLVPIDSLEPWPGNPRRGDVDAVAASLKRFGQVRAIVVEGSRIVAGHHVVLAAKELGWTHVAAIEGEFENEDEAQAFLVADNRTSELGTFDLELLDAQLRAIRERTTLEGTGYLPIDADQLALQLKRLHAATARDDGDDIPPVPSDPKSKAGEVYELGPHRLMCGDSTDRSHVEILMNGEQAPLLFTSPPYLDARDYGGDNLGVDHLASFVAVWSDFCDLLAVNLGIIRRGNEVVRYWDSYIAQAEDAGLRLLSWNVWDRGQPWSIAQNTAMFPIEHEFVFVFGEKASRLALTVANKSPGMRTGITNRQQDGTLKQVAPKKVRDFRPLGTVFRSPPYLGKDVGHPAVFPAVFPTAYIDAATQPGEIVLEPFAGSGTTLIACEQSERRCFAMEIDPGYCDIVRQRYAKYVERPELEP